MGHSYCHIWIHLILVTKHRKKFINREIEKEIYQFLTSKLEELKCDLEAINGLEDHVHILFKQNKQLSIAQIAKQLKGGASFFLNSSFKLEEKFQWQNGYSAFSVSYNDRLRIKKYIQNQKKNCSHQPRV